MKRVVTIAALLFASGLMTSGGVLACLYTMPGCHTTPACHHQTTKAKPASCCNGLTPGRTISVPSSRFTLGTPGDALTSAPVLAPVATRETLAAVPAFKTSLPIFTLRV